MLYYVTSDSLFTRKVSQNEDQRWFNNISLKREKIKKSRKLKFLLSLTTEVS